MTPDVLRQAQSIAEGVMSNVDSAQLTASTPCESWDVASLIDHMVGSQLWGEYGIEGRELTESGEGSAQGDYVATFTQAANRTAEAFSAEGAMERTVNPGFGDMPAPALLGLVITDTFAHAWDLAKATGQDTNLDPQLASQLLAGAKQAIPDAFRGPEGAPFGPQQSAPEGASQADQLAAFLGRKV